MATLQKHQTGYRARWVLYELYLRMDDLQEKFRRQLGEYLYFRLTAGLGHELVNSLVMVIEKPGAISY